MVPGDRITGHVDGVGEIALTSAGRVTPVAMKLYNFFRSGTSHRLRIALNLKGVPMEYVPVDLRTEQHWRRPSRR